MMKQYPLPTLAPGLVDSSSMVGDETATQARVVMNRLNTALATDDAETLEGCFYADQAYWKDQLALTWHLRTFSSPSTIAAGLLETAKLRIVSGIEVDGAAMFVPVTPVLVGSLLNPISSIVLSYFEQSHLPVSAGILSTRLESLAMQPENENLCYSGKQLDGPMDFETDVYIIGAGNARWVLSVMIDRHARPGDNWALRYDRMQFHIPTSFYELRYGKELQSPHLLTRQDLADQIRRYVHSFNLNVINSANIQWTEYNEATKTWHITFQTPVGQRMASSKHLVLATGIGSQKPHMPQIAEPHSYKGISIHSAQYKNPKVLREKGANFAMINGSANTAFDVLVDCHNAGLDATIVARSPTYVVPLDYVCHRMSLGVYDAGVDAADRLFLPLPTVVDGQLGRDLFAIFASKEPERYSALEAAGFPVLDSRDLNCALMHNPLGRAGGHYIDVGGTKLIEEKSCADADAIIWCTGFSNSNVVTTATEILGGKSDAIESVAEAETETNSKQKHILGPQDIASRLDATWGLDEEGEIRGMWKRHLNVDNFWVMGGYTQQHRWHSRTLALQIKAALEGRLPPAYRHTPP
ncbi:hypothetical protein CBS147353_11334 [Aspergillus niger]|nr:hypothetical protein CBS147353_11334 [Aspergillus niger]